MQLLFEDFLPTSENKQDAANSAGRSRRVRVYLSPAFMADPGRYGEFDGLYFG